MQSNRGAGRRNQPEKGRAEFSDEAIRRVGGEPKENARLKAVESM
jgi:hypothetical protein